ncbi:hypothetical protein GY45DRAFT_495151 [Cubamyces sp. BRFM 1775]|nr:hypothetical protein GY45DRAFT_495151 [Cubamyces sp. BRFM 1775]
MGRAHPPRFSSLPPTPSRTQARHQDEYWHHFHTPYSPYTDGTRGTKRTSMLTTNGFLFLLVCFLYIWPRGVYEHHRGSWIRNRDRLWMRCCCVTRNATPAVSSVLRVRADGSRKERGSGKLYVCTVIGF